MLGVFEEDVVDVLENLGVKVEGLRTHLHEERLLETFLLDHLVQVSVEVELVLLAQSEGKSFADVVLDHVEVLLFAFRVLVVVFIARVLLLGKIAFPIFQIAQVFQRVLLLVLELVVVEGKLVDEQQMEVDVLGFQDSQFSLLLVLLEEIHETLVLEKLHVQSEELEDTDHRFLVLVVFQDQEFQQLEQSPNQQLFIVKSDEEIGLFEEVLQLLKELIGVQLDGNFRTRVAEREENAIDFVEEVHGQWAVLGNLVFQEKLQLDCQLELRGSKHGKEVLNHAGDNHQDPPHSLCQVELFLLGVDALEALLAD